jgi:hypothetical protein
MKFLCLGYLNMDDFDAAPEATRQAVLTECFEQCVPFRATGKVTLEEGVQHYSLSRTIRPVNGEPTVSAGPLFQAAAQLGSVFIIEADSMEAAIAVASLHPAAILGEEYGFGIEIRPLQ